MGNGQNAGDNNWMPSLRENMTNWSESQVASSGGGRREDLDRTPEVTKPTLDVDRKPGFVEMCLH